MSKIGKLSLLAIVFFTIVLILSLAKIIQRTSLNTKNEAALLPLISPTPSFTLPIIANNPNYIRLNVKYVNSRYPGGRTNFYPYQAVHPDVVYIPEKWNGYSYWLVTSPFPNRNPKYEDPHVFASNDNVNWLELGRNPVVPLIDPCQHEYSDADMLLVDNVMYIYYRKNIINKPTSIQPPINNDECNSSLEDYTNYHTTVLYRIYSTDGRNWSTPELTSIYNISPSGRFASPAVIYENGQWLLFFVDTLNKNVHLAISNDGKNWGGNTAIFSTKLDLGSNLSANSVSPWHVDVIKYNSRYLMLLNVKKEGSGTTKPPRYLYLYSSSNKISWNYLGVLLSPSTTGSWDSSEIYRSSAVIEGAKFRLWYSGFQGDIAHTGYSEDPNWLPTCNSWTDVYINNCDSFNKFIAQSRDPACITSPNRQPVIINISPRIKANALKIYNPADYNTWCNTLKGYEPGWTTEMNFNNKINWYFNPSKKGNQKICVMLKNNNGWGPACGAGIFIQ